MANFDPAMKRETWVFQSLRNANSKKQTWKRLKFNLVRYDGDPVQYVQPVNLNELAGDSVVFDPYTHGGIVEDFMFIDGTFSLFEVFNIQ